MVVLEARELVKRYGRRAVLESADLTVHAGEMVGVAGGNGAGKSTLLGILAGFQRPDSGAVSVRTRIGYCPQATLLYDRLTVEEHFRYFSAARQSGGAWRDSAMELARRYRFDPWWREPTGALSEGTRQKLNLALALVHDPGLLLLDEPYSGFDWETYLLFWEHAEALRRDGKTLLVVSHLFYDRSRFDRVLRLDAGRIREEAPPVA